MILSIIIFCGFIVSGYLIAKKISLEKLGRRGVILLPIIILGGASITTYAVSPIQSHFEPKHYGQINLSWRTDFLERANSSLPPGFEIEVVLDNLILPTSVTMGDNGDVYLATAKGILLIQENLERVSMFYPYEREHHILGLAFNNGSLYIARGGTVVKLQDTNGDGSIDDSKEIISDLPHQEYSNHSNNGITFGPDGLLYMTLGSTSDHGPEESPIAGSVLVMNRDGTGLATYARGFRNPFDLTFCSDGKLFVTDNGPDQMNFEEDPDTDRLVYRPPDELNLVYEGRNYGYPESFGYPAPWLDTEPPVSIFPMSAVATGVACYEGDLFPEEYKNNLFVTLWGSMVIPEQTGHKLVRVDLEEKDDFVIGTVHNFVDLWRPVDVIVYNDGSLLVLDFDAAKLYRISYVGT